MNFVKWLLLWTVVLKMDGDDFLRVMILSFSCYRYLPPCTISNLV